jgi:hypothetical protein
MVHNTMIDQPHTHLHPVSFVMLGCVISQFFRLFLFVCLRFFFYFIGVVRIIEWYCISFNKQRYHNAGI